ncbi:MAG: ChbG/HpnK family deacetylase [Planctomycetes bacterium]|nr:ChbG/HpnK family deacetylase [Planctomycetota bacterium]
MLNLIWELPVPDRVIQQLFRFLLLASIAGLASCSKVSTENGEEYLLVSSDDAGMCRSVNLATIDALERGIVQSTSIMTCCPAFDEFAEYAVEHLHEDYGVHLTLTCDLPKQPWGPVLPASEVPSLVDEDGTFWPTSGEVGRYAVLDEAERELRAQIQKAHDCGIRITHLDHHMFVLFARQDLFELYVRLGIEYGYPIRIVRKFENSRLEANGNEWGTTSHQAMLGDIIRSGFLPLDSMESSNYGTEAEKKRAYHLNTIRNLSPGVTELVVHCAYEISGEVEPPDVERRVADTEFVLSEEAAAELRRSRVKLIDCRHMFANVARSR